MNESKLILVLGDQLSLNQPALKQAEPGRDIIVLAEVAEEATYVRHNRHKIALLFAAMRHFRVELETLGYDVYYTAIDQGVASLEEAVRNVLVQTAATEVVVCELTDNDFGSGGLYQDVTNRLFETRHTLIDGGVVDVVPQCLKFDTEVTHGSEQQRDLVSVMAHVGGLFGNLSKHNNVAARLGLL